MRKDVTLITNNPCFQQEIDQSCLMFIDGTSLDVLIAARDAVHLGSALLTHPLYGNLRPNRQPFRSVLLRDNKDNKKINFTDSGYLESVSGVEEAVLIYQSYGGRLTAPENLPEAARDDYMFVDSELMRESLMLYGLIH